jgi:hypothetical protein
MYPVSAYLDTPEVATPVGAQCAHCRERIVEGDDGWLSSNDVPFHRACWMRSIIGSIAHIEERCGCFVPGATENDPPEMTRRQAAEAALAAWNERHPWSSENR